MEQWLHHIQLFCAVTLRRCLNVYFQTLKSIFGRRSEASTSWAVWILIQQGDLPSAVACSKQPYMNLQILPRMHFVKFSPVNQIDQTAMLVPARVSGVRVNAST